MENIIRFRLGDYYGVGHGMHNEFYVHSNKTRLELEEAYAKQKELLGFSISDLCDDYQDSCLKEHEIKKLESAGISVNCDEEGFINVYEFFCLEMAILQKNLTRF